jgi:hypothetical protein
MLVSSNRWFCRRSQEWSMGTQEYLLLAMVILVPLVIATVVTLWTLEQARMRSKKHRKGTRPKVDAGAPPTDPVV